MQEPPPTALDAELQNAANTVQRKNIWRPGRRAHNQCQLAVFKTMDVDLPATMQMQANEAGEMDFDGGGKRVPIRDAPYEQDKCMYRLENYWLPWKRLAATQSEQNLSKTNKDLPLQHPTGA